MAIQEYEVSGRIFRNPRDYQAGLRDQEKIQKLKDRTDLQDIKQVQELIQNIDNKKYVFETLLGEDFLDELLEKEKHLKNAPAEKTKKPVKIKKNKKQKEIVTIDTYDESMQLEIKRQLRKREQRRKMLVAVFGLVALSCLFYVGYYMFYYEKNSVDYKKLAKLKEKDSHMEEEYTITYSDDPDAPPILEKYKNLYNKNKKLIGWLKIDDTNIDYPVMQTVNNDYYLDHNFNQEYDKNGSIFLDKDCNAAFPNTNMIIYGHHMKSGKMFGNLNYYSKESYYRQHPRIYFDTIYEEGVYDIMYVFRSKIYNEEDIVFKYYQFIDVNSSEEFYSAMEEMERLSLYDTGVRAVYGDKLITLSTCDNSEEDGRFVVVAKKVK